ncbi:MAG: pre-peptidase C-terminal domain-containing protein [Planctomycetota bacterium]
MKYVCVMKFLTLPVVFLVSLFSTQLLSAQTTTGELSSADGTIETGAYFDETTIDVVAGQQLSITLTSSNFDTFLIAVAPSGDALENDDSDGITESQLNFTADESGQWKIIVTSYKPGETGNYELKVSGVAAPTPDADFTDSGTLGEGDSQLGSGEWFDVYTHSGQAGDPCTIVMSSGNLTPYVIIEFPDGDEQEEIDAHNYDGTNAVLTLRLPQTGEYRILATTHEPGESGDYLITIDESMRFLPLGNDETVVAEGTLNEGDSTFSTGEYRELFQIETSSGDQIEIELDSEQFDPYLSLFTPSNGRIRNDDGGDGSNSRVVIPSTEAGIYRIYATTYEPGESGDYSIEITSRSRSALREVVLNQPVDGELRNGDEERSPGQLVDLFRYEGAAGDSLQVDMQAGFDTKLYVISPSGVEYYNDDISDGNRNSRVQIQLQETGTYRIEATSYDSGKTGEYFLNLSEFVYVAPEPSEYDERLFGVFAGNTYYSDDDVLNFCAEDAITIRDALESECGMNSGDSHLMLAVKSGVSVPDEAIQSSAENFQAAIADVASEAGPGDIVFIFYSGHGGRYPREDTPPTDADGIDETLAFPDFSITDDQLAEMLSAIDDDTLVILVLDSCFSGGFAKDIVSRPNRVGIFSSEEDTTSLTAGKFEAGGYLSRFFADAIEDGEADTNQDSQFSAHEIYHYLRRRYDTELTADAPAAELTDDYIQAGDNFDYQNLVTDDSVPPGNPILFRR